MKTRSTWAVITGMVVLALFLMVNAQPLQAQDSTKFLTLSGKLLDKDSRDPLVFATVYVVGTSIGTVSNSDGEFILKIPVNLSNPKIGVKHIGYHNYSVPVSKLATGEMN